MSRVAFALLSLVALTNCNNLQDLATTWYPVALYKSAGDGYIIEKTCDPSKFTVEQNAHKCGEFNGYQYTLVSEDSTLTGVEVNSYEDAVKAMNTTCENDNSKPIVIRFLNNYAVCYTAFENDITYVGIIAKSVPTDNELKEILKTVPEIKDYTGRVTCTKEIQIRNSEEYHIAKKVKISSSGDKAKHFLPSKSFVDIFGKQRHH